MLFLLFVDQLGTRSKWQEGGSDLAMKHISRLEQLIRLTLNRLEPASLQEGIVESDSVGLVFSSLRETFVFGRELFRAAFGIDKNRRLGEGINYLWLRGAIVPFEAELPLRREESIVERFPSVSVSRFSSSLLNAIAIEKSSFKGMRIVMSEGSILNRSVRRSAACFRHKDGFIISPFARLPHAMYPGRLSDGFFDFLWMTTDSGEEWRKWIGMASRKLHFTAGNQEEFLHAAATLVVFLAAAYKFKKQSKEKESFVAYPSAVG